MRLKTVAGIVLVLTLLTISAVSASQPVHQLSGGGKLTLEDGTFETYGFVAQVDGDDVARGQGEIHVHGDVMVHFRVNCLAVDGNTAWLGMVVTRTDDPTLAPLGMDFTWQLQDNGEGKNAPPDLQSFIFPTVLLPVYGLGNDCSDQGNLFALGIFEWQDGNIQVR